MGVRVSQAVLTALWAKPTASPTSPSAGNVAVSHAVLTALMVPVTSVRVAQVALTALVTTGDDQDTPPSGGGGGTTSYGYPG